MHRQIGFTCHAERLLHTKQTCGMTITKMVCGLLADSDSVHHADNRLPSPTLSLSVRTACGSARSAPHATAVGLTHTGLGGWTRLGAATPVVPQGLEGSTPWLTSYRFARSKQGITASSSLTCSNTAISELTTGSNTQPSDSTNLRATMQHKSSTALIWHDISQLGCKSDGFVGWCSQGTSPLGPRYYITQDAFFMSKMLFTQIITTSSKNNCVIQSIITRSMILDQIQEHML